MKKKHENVRISLGMIKLLRIMKLTTLFLIVMFVQSFASSFAQTEFSFTMEDATIKEVIEHLEQESEFYFFLKQDKEILNKKVDVVFENKSIEQVLDKLLEDTNLSYEIVDKYIAITPVDELDTVFLQKKNKIIGKVTDESGTSLPGVSIVVKGSLIGVTSDIEGNYTLKIPEDAQVLVFSFIGMKSQEVVIAGRSTIDLVLEQETIGLNEIVAIGYGVQSKAKVTGAISKIKAEDLNAFAGSSFEQQLSGKMAGVSINQTSGQPGQDAQIIIRGTGTITAGTNPLIVVDGLPLAEGSSLSSINPNDIESVDILKDAASASIYGSRASNGVIVVTTKKGKAGKLQISFDAYSGTQYRSDKVEYVDAYDAATFFTEGRDWGYVSKGPENRTISDDRATRISKGATKRQLRLNYLDPYLKKEKGLTNTDWMDVIMRPANISNYSLSLSGGSEKTDYFVSANVFNQEGIVEGTDYERYSSTIKINSKINSWVDFGISLNLAHYTQNSIKSLGNWSTDPVSMTITAYPFFSPYNDDGSLAISTQLLANTPEDGALQENPLAIAKKLDNKTSGFRSFGNAFLNFKLTEGLSFKTLFGGDFRSDVNNYFNPSDVGQYRSPLTTTTVGSETTKRRESYISENLFNYKETFGDHDIDILVGFTYQQEVWNKTVINGTGFPDDNIRNIAGASDYAVDPYKSKWTQVSYLARAQYFYKNKYQMSLAIRRDGSSRFGEKTKWGAFPSVSLGWIVSDEGFYPKWDALNFTKLRVSWGETGNNQIGAYSAQAIVSGDDYVYGDVLVPGYSSKSSPNPHLSWETNSSYNVGLDFGLFNKLNVSTNYYHSTTSDLLLDVPVPEHSGYSTSKQNLGKVRNTGLEFEVSSNQINLGKVKWSFSGNISTNKNKVLDLGSRSDGGITTGKEGAFRTRVGGPIAEMNGYKITGVYKTQKEIDDTPHLKGTLTGDYIVEDVNKDNKIDEADRVGCGTYQPKYRYGFSSNFTYKQFDLSFSLEGVEGRKIYDRWLAFLGESGEGFSHANQYYFDNRYHPVNNPNGFLAQPNTGNFSSARKKTRASNYTFYNADYLRLRTLKLAYSIPKEMLSKIGLTQAKIYFSANNLFTITDYRGYNLEKTSDNTLISGYSNWGGYPIPKSYIIGVNLKF